MAFQIRYAVPMHCSDCQSTVSSALEQLAGVDKVEVDLDRQEVVVKGRVPPSSVVDCMQSIGKDAFVRGSGRPNTSAVCILEDEAGEVGGLARLVEVANSTVLLDISLTKQIRDNVVDITVHQFGDLSQVPQSLGPEVAKVGSIARQRTNTWNTLEGTALADMIGRSLHTSSKLFGVIARSAGLWENDKTVCSCTGKTLWEERQSAIQRHSYL